MPEYPLYIGAKLIRAAKMSLAGFCAQTGREPPKQDAPGYHVIYPDGYQSWSPKEAFETAYRMVEGDEAKITQGCP